MASTPEANTLTPELKRPLRCRARFDPPPPKLWTKEAKTKWLNIGLTPVAAMLRGWVLPIWYEQQRRDRERTGEAIKQPSITTLAPLCGSSGATVVRAIRELEDRELLRVIREKGQPNAYELLDPVSSYLYKPRRGAGRQRTPKGTFAARGTVSRKAAVTVSRMDGSNSVSALKKRNSENSPLHPPVPTNNGASGFGVGPRGA
jgi:hypothetical protein